MRQLSLLLDDGAGSEDDDYRDEFDWEEEDEVEEEGGASAGDDGAQEWGQAGVGRPMLDPPSLGGVPNLVGLEVRRGVAPPPDWRHLSGLVSLDLLCWDPGISDWSLPLTGLQSLTRLGIGRHTLDKQRDGAFPPAICQLPALRCLELAPPTW